MPSRCRRRPWRARRPSRRRGSRPVCANISMNGEGRPRTRSAGRNRVVWVNACMAPSHPSCRSADRNFLISDMSGRKPSRPSCGGADRNTSGFAPQVSLSSPTLVQECGSKQHVEPWSGRLARRHPSRRARIETATTRCARSPSMSLPTRERGSKLLRSIAEVMDPGVASHVGARIETNSTSTGYCRRTVALHAGAWIETPHSWSLAAHLRSLLTRERGSKHLLSPHGRGLSASLLMRELGSKRRTRYGNIPRHRVALHAGARIETCVRTRSRPTSASLFTRELRSKRDDPRPLRNACGRVSPHAAVGIETICSTPRIWDAKSPLAQERGSKRDVVRRVAGD